MIGMNKGDDTFECDQSSIADDANSESDEPWAIRFAEMLRLEIASNI